MQAAIAVIAILGACSTRHQAAAVPTTTTTVAPASTPTSSPDSTTTSTALDPSASPCSIDDLDVAIADPDPASAGQRVPGIAIRNHSSVRCNFDGKLEVRFLPSGNGPEVVAPRTADTAYPTITLLPCGTAWAEVDYREFVGADSLDHGSVYNGARASLTPGGPQVRVLMTSALTIHQINSISPFTSGAYPYPDTFSSPTDHTTRLDPTRLFTVCPGR
jgi:hypothetical protein